MSTDSRPRLRDSPRAEFFRRFGELFEAAGNPTLRRLEAAAKARMRAAKGGGAGGGASMQRISDWKAGRNLPARFDSLRPVLLTLIEEARKSSQPVSPALLDVREWLRLWTASAKWNPESSDATSPYLGLTSYRREDAELFFGRVRPSVELAELVRSTVGPEGAGGMVMVVGASGAGKSSLLEAGLLPALVQHPDEWATAGMTPGERPMKALGAVIDQDEWRPDLRRLLIVDQLEELFTQCHDDEQRDEFLASLQHFAIRGEHDPVAVVVAVRADFYARCLDHPVLEDALKHRSYLLGPMRLNELAEAITGPAELAGYRLETGLEELVIAELCGLGGRTERHGYDPGALPLLSHVMAAVWRRRDGARLTIDGYRAAGGVHGSVAATAEQAWRELTEFEQAAAKQLLLELVTFGQDSKDTRREVSRTELIRRTVETSESALEALARTRLVTLDAESVYLTHEIVLDAWPRLRGWIDEDRVGSLERQRLHADAADWTKAARDPSRLYRGARLDAAERHVTESGLTDDAAEFLSAARMARRRSRRLASATRIALTMLGVCVAVLALVAFAERDKEHTEREDALLAAVIDQADRLRTIDPSVSADLDLEANRLSPPGNPDVVTRLVATQNLPLSTAVETVKGAVFQLAYDHSGGVLATGDDDTDNTIQLWDVRDPLHPRRLGPALPASPGGLTSAAFSSDGKILASSGEDHQVRLWNVADPQAPVAYPSLSGMTGQIAFSQTGFMLTSFTSDHRAELWDMTDPAHPTPIGEPFHPNEADPRLVALSRHGNLLAIGGHASGDAVELWDVHDPWHPHFISRVTDGILGGVASIALSPNNGMLAAGSDDGRVSLWDISTPSAPTVLIAPLTAAGSTVQGLAFSPDSRVLVEASEDKSTQLWSLADPARPHRLGLPLADANESVYAVAYSPDGRVVVTGGDAGSIRFWSLPATPLVSPTDYYAPEFSKDGRRMVSVSQDGSMAEWDTSDPAHPNALAQNPLGSDFKDAWAFSADGTRFAADVGDVMRVYDVSPRGVLRSVMDLPSGGTRIAAFSADSGLLATVRWSDGLVRVWDLAQPAQAAWSIREPSGVAEFSPRGRVLAVTGPGNAIVLWDVRDPEHPRPCGSPLTGNAKPVDDLGFSPDGRTLATVGQDKTLRLWDIGNLDQPVPRGDPAVTGESLPNSVSFSPRGDQLAIGSEDGGVQLWSLTDRSRPRKFGVSIAPEDAIGWYVAFDPARWDYLAASHLGNVIQMMNLYAPDAVRRICTLTPGSLTPERWREYLPQVPYRPLPCS